jgi:hypothetical protein
VRAEYHRLETRVVIGEVSQARHASQKREGDVERLKRMKDFHSQPL